jgi:hypothetical protein
MIQTRNLHFSRELFNSLPTIESANASLEIGNKLETALDLLGPIFLRHDLHTFWGVSLLHNHFQLEQNEKATQKIVQKGNRKWYVTEPQTCIDESVLYPAVYKIGSDGELLPLEFTIDPIAFRANSMLAQKKHFVSDLCKALIDNALIQTFGIIYSKDLNPSFELIEFNYSNRISVLKESLAKEVMGMSLIKTSWFFSPGLHGAKCTSKCFARCVVSNGNHASDHPQYHDPNG